MATKSDAKAAAITMLHAMEYLQKTYGDGIGMRPWASKDHPISQAHWMLVQGRINAAWTARKISDNPKAQQRGLKGVHTVENRQEVAS